MNKHFWYSVFALVGTTIGVGIFGLPYVFFKAGFFVGFFEIILLGLVVLLVQQMLGEIVLRTEGKKRLIGLAQIYLGSKWHNAVFISVILGSVGALLAYFIIGGDFLAILTGLGSFKASLVFFVFWLFAILIKPKSFGRAEFYLSGLVILIVAFLTLFTFKFVDFHNFYRIDLKNIFLPYGLILFAVTGSSVIPEMEDILEGEKEKLNKAIFLGTLVPILIYLIFAFTVLGVSGALISQDSISGLALALNSSLILKLGALLGLVTVAGASLSQGIYLKETFLYDLKLTRWASWALTGFLPLLLFLMGLRSFIFVASIVGAFVFGFQAIVILMIHKTAKLKPQYFYFIIASVLILGTIFGLWPLFKIF